jgi:2-keto-3-deoxy-L-rhamnonate aldolase RhmA
VTTTDRPSIRDRVRAGEATVGTWLGLGSAHAAEQCGRAGFDWVVIDTEHGMGTESDVLDQLYAVGATPAAAIVRVERSDRLRIGRMLDLGADGLVIPRLDTPDEVREAVSWMRFPPTGIRGLALGARGQGFGEVGHGEVRLLNERPLGVFQVESPVAVRNAAEIAAIVGVDVLFVGPADLSHSMGLPGRFDDPLYLDALRAVVGGATAAGKQAGILIRTADAIDLHLELGFRFIGIGADYWFIADGARAAAAAARARLPG